jgi:hypothetical protein
MAVVDQEEPRRPSGKWLARVKRASIDAGCRQRHVVTDSVEPQLPILSVLPELQHGLLRGEQRVVSPRRRRIHVAVQKP